MSSIDGNPSAFPGRNKDGAWRQLLAAALGVLPLYATLISYQLRRGGPAATGDFIFYLALISPAAIIVVLLLLRFLCGESPRELNLKKGGLRTDLASSLVLIPVILAANIASTFMLAELFPDRSQDASVRNLFLNLSDNPGLLILFVGLLLMLGATSEEIVRIFMLSRLWKIWPATTSKLLSVAISAMLFGLVHAYRGPVHVGWTTIYGLLMALWYLRYGRAVPLIVAHYATNTIQVVAFVV